MSEEGRKFVAVNRKARHEYFIEDTIEAGICLAGTEVKSIRAGKGSLQDSFVKIENGEAWLYNMYVAPYEQGNRYNQEPRRKRKLLLHKFEIERLAIKSQQKGLALVPIQMYFKHGHAKVEVGLGKGKKLYDKRDSIAEKDMIREQARSLVERG
jgi:SsrA-binding protein